MATYSTSAIAFKAKEQADFFLDLAARAETPRAAADWSLAAKNAIQVALTCEQIPRTKGAR
jgi:hypothetical protein